MGNIQPYYQDEAVKIYHGDCREILPLLVGVTAVVTDPPYGLGFMGKEWDHDSPRQAFWEAIATACLPGAPLLSFGATRTYHRLTSAIEDAGWEIRDCLMWIYGSGFPKSLDVGKAIDKAAGVERGVGLWDGYGTALKPAYEPILLARKPLEGTVAQNVQKYGTGALWIDGGRVGDVQGRWPANVIHDGSEEVVELFPEAKVSGSAKSGKPAMGEHYDSESIVFGKGLGAKQGRLHNDSGSAARFFYCAKASKAERDAGVDVRNNHPTIKPLALMHYLITLVLQPERNLILDPFMGSGTILRATKDLGRKAIGIEIEEQYCEIAVKRMAQTGFSL